MSKIPTFQYERMLIAQGFRMIVGVDEAGCGALAGPVSAGAVVLPLNSRLGALRDSKLLSPEQRDVLYPLIIKKAIAWAVGIASVEEIAQFNIRGATFLAMRRAVAQIEGTQVLLVDAWKIPAIDLPQYNIVRGDLLIKSIAAASVVAKVTRDRMMRELHDQYPDYRFDMHKGYGTDFHRRAIETYGPCPIHRLSYKIFEATNHVSNLDDE
jgi:ribonuclease HII